MKNKKRKNDLYRLQLLRVRIIIKILKKYLHTTIEQAQQITFNKIQSLRDRDLVKKNYILMKVRHFFPNPLIYTLKLCLSI